MSNDEIWSEKLQSVGVQGRAVRTVIHRLHHVDGRSQWREERLTRRDGDISSWWRRAGQAGLDDIMTVGKSRESNILILWVKDWERLSSKRDTGEICRAGLTERLLTQDKRSCPGSRTPGARARASPGPGQAPTTYLVTKSSQSRHLLIHKLSIATRCKL